MPAEYAYAFGASERRRSPSEFRGRQPGALVIIPRPTGTYRRRTLLTRKLGSQDLEVSAPGLGCMGMSDFYGDRDEAESVPTINFALDRGVTFLDTADMYGEGANEELVGRVIRERRDWVVVATKFGIHRGLDGKGSSINGRPDHVRRACDPA